MSAIRDKLVRFRRDDGGYMVIEAVLVLPIMLWAFMGLYSFWDAYRATTTIQKATYAISDLISRSQGAVDAAFIEGMRSAMDQMIPTRMTAEIRVTSIRRNETEERFEVHWSCVAGSINPKHTTASLENIAHKIPGMADGTTVFLVESWVDYDPILNIGVNEQRISQFIITRPRYLALVEMSTAC